MCFDQTCACGLTAGQTFYYVSGFLKLCFNSSAQLGEVLWSQRKGQSQNTAHSHDPAVDLQLVATQHHFHNESPEHALQGVA